MKNITFTQIRRILREAVFNPKSNNVMKAAADVKSVEYYEKAALVIIKELDQSRYFNELYKVRIKMAIRLLAMAEATRENELKEAKDGPSEN